MKTRNPPQWRRRPNTGKPTDIAHEVLHLDRPQWRLRPKTTRTGAALGRSAPQALAAMEAPSEDDADRSLVSPSLNRGNAGGFERSCRTRKPRTCKCSVVKVPNLVVRGFRAVPTASRGTRALAAAQWTRRSSPRRLLEGAFVVTP